LFSAFSATSHPRKGGHFLLQAIDFIAKNYRKTDIELVVLGAAQPLNEPKLGLPVHYLGNLVDEISQIILYSAADLLVAPSMQENLSNTVLESLSCGTPVVAFNIGGMPDLITHHNNGYLVNSFDIEDLATGIMWALASDERIGELSLQSRLSVIDKYSFPVVAQCYSELYQTVISQS